MSDHCIRFSGDFEGVVKTEELIPGKVMADYDSNGALVGIEVLGAFNCHHRHRAGVVGNCITCKKPVSQDEHGCLNEAIGGVISGGYGSRYDLQSIAVYLCDDCTQKTGIETLAEALA